MKRFFIFCLFIFSASTVFAQNTAADSTAIRSTIQQFENAWNKNDMDAYCSLFTPDGSWINIGGMRWKNRDEVSKAMHILAPVFKYMIPQKLNILDIQFLGDNAAIVFIKEVIQINHDWSYPDGRKGNSKGDINYGQMSLVMVKNNDGQWQIKAGHNTTIDPKVAAFNPAK